MDLQSWINTHQQAITSGLMILTFIAFLWGKIRYDIVALGALMIFVILGIVPVKQAFVGFSHPAVVTIAAVLILSRAVSDTGITYYASKYLTRFSKHPSMLILLLSGLVAALSGFMNDVGALAIVMPIALQISTRYKIPTSLLLMPMAFASLLGGTMTLIGTPPNLIISHYRANNGLGQYAMFDFLPVGIIVTIVGLIYISLIGWRFLPIRAKNNSQTSFETESYIIEMRVPKNGKLKGKTIAELIEMCKADITVVALLRGARRLLDPMPLEILKENDSLLIEGQPDDIKPLQSLSGLVFTSAKNIDPKIKLETIEVVINRGARIANRQLDTLNLRILYDVNVLGIARLGETIRQRLSKVILKSGDVLILQSTPENISQSLQDLGCLPLAERDKRITPSINLIPTLSVFILSILAVVFNIFPAEISFPLAVFVLLSTKWLSLKTAYASIEGSLIILLGCFITVGNAIETTGVTHILVSGLISLFSDMPGYVMLGLVLLCCMLLTDVLNNSATAVIMAPIGVGVANSLGHNIDPYLMAVCIGCSCAFNTPIGHHSNTLVMGPGGYKFGDYWRMGLLLDALLLITTVPALIYFWPLTN